MLTRGGGLYFFFGFSISFKSAPKFPWEGVTSKCHFWVQKASKIEQAGTVGFDMTHHQIWVCLH